MEKPEKLFEDGPEWEWWEKVRCWHVLIADQIHTAKRAPAGGWILGHDVDVEGGDGTWCETDDVGWLRSRIIAHRDELNRVTGAGLRWVPIEGLTLADGQEYWCLFRVDTETGYYRAAVSYQARAFDSVHWFDDAGEPFPFPDFVLCTADGTAVAIPPLPETKP